jgi:MFS family permease
MLTVVFGAYAFGALAALLLAGRLSDEFGRRPLLAAGLSALLGAMLLFSFARSLEWLLAARLVQGVATGIILSAAGAALVELAPHRDPRRAGLANGVSASLGIGAGALVSSLLVQSAPDPRVTPFAVLGTVLVAVLGGVVTVPETVTSAAHQKLRPQRPVVPSEVRGALVLASAGVVASWSIAGLYLSLAPSLSMHLLDTNSHIAGGAAVFALGGSAGLGQIVFRNLLARQAIAAGSTALAVGTVGTIAATLVGSDATFVVGSVVVGGGWGVAFMGALRSVSAAAPDQHRAGVMSAFYVVAYLALSLPSMIAGLAVPGLGIEPTYRIFGAAVVALAVITAAGTRRSGATARAASPCVESRA